MKHNIYFLIILSFISANLIFGQDNIYNLTWENTSIRLENGQSVYIPSFEYAIHSKEFDYLPLYFNRLSISQLNNQPKIELINEKFEPITDPTFSFFQNSTLIHADIELNSQISLERKKPFLDFDFIPIRYNKISGFYEKLVSFELKITEGETKMSMSSKGRTYTDNSVLAEGTWYKIGVQKTGIYKITKTELEEMGMNLSGINPKKLSLHGNGTGRLSESPVSSYIDDLQENAIFISGENDGVFNDDDYILFYAKGPHQWEYDQETALSEVDYNIYDEYSYYFLNIGNDDGKRIEIQNSEPGTPAQIVETYNGALHHEVDLENIIGSGRKWVGESFEFNTTMVESIEIPNLLISEPINFHTEVLASSEVSSLFSFSNNNTNFLNLSVPSISEGSYTPLARISEKSTDFFTNNKSFDLKIVYNKPLNSSKAWLDYFTLNYISELSYYGSQMDFRSSPSAEEINISKFILSNANSNIDIWNVTDPINVTKINTVLTGNKLSFQLLTDTLFQFIAFNNTDFLSIEFKEIVDNQNLHALHNIDMIIITPSDFIEDADRLADFHREQDQMSVITVEVEKIYNEFASGSQDITAIRDFLKMLYDNAPEGEEPQYVLFFGDASYDYKDIVSGNTNFIPSWESPESTHPIYSYATDDFFCYLDDVALDNSLDISSGRFVIKNQQQAKQTVDKTIHYAIKSPEVMKNWRNNISLVADDEDNNLHFQHAEILNDLIDTINQSFNVEKIYLDSYQQESTPSGDRYQEAADEIGRTVDRGVLIMNYVGHGGEGGWAHERILTITDINNWGNYDHLPLFVTATCEFSRYDDPKRVSGGEYVFLNPQGGGIALFTTSRATYAGNNSALNQKLYEYSLRKYDGDYLRLGDILKNAKNSTSGNNDKSTENKKYILLGDPAIKLAIPEYNVSTKYINGNPADASSDTLTSLSKVTISGEITDGFGNKLNNFNGILTPTVFDKPMIYATLANDPENSSESNFLVQNNILYKGNASIVNGEWEFSFIVPKDIVIELGEGKISYYAKNESTDAHGYYHCLVGGFNANAEQDNVGPEINLFLNGDCFEMGDVIGENPILYAQIFDKNGINTASGGIGHDIIATLDQKNTINLNRYYEADLDTYQSGSITFPFFNLEEGDHEISLKVWDVYNNSSTATINFVVNASDQIIINNLICYPNPVNPYNGTRFSFKHNQCDTDMEIKLEIYSITGQLVYTIEEFYNAGDCKFDSEPWYGNNENGHPLNSGMYIYKIIAKKPNGTISIDQNKLILLK